MVSIDAVLADKLQECAAMLVGRPGRLGNITPGKREHPLNAASFKIHNESFLGILKRFERRHLRKPDIAGIDCPPLQMRHGTFDHVPQLPRISRPVVKHSSWRKALYTFPGIMRMFSGKRPAKRGMSSRRFRQRNEVPIGQRRIDKRDRWLAYLMLYGLCVRRALSGRSAATKTGSYR